MALYKILSIDGGGIRGVIPAVLLTEMEKRTGESISSLFDLIVGTSTGGILAAGLVAPASLGHESASPGPKFKASDLLALYEEHGKDIFKRSHFFSTSKYIKEIHLRCCLISGVFFDIFSEPDGRSFTVGGNLETIQYGRVMDSSYEGAETRYLEEE